MKLLESTPLAMNAIQIYYVFFWIVCLSAIYLEYFKLNHLVLYLQLNLNFMSAKSYKMQLHLFLRGSFECTF